VYVCKPAVAVSSAPGLDFPLESVHDLIPGPLAPSTHVNDVRTTAPTPYVPPVRGPEIAAIGAAATVYLIEAVIICPAVLIAVTVYVCDPGVPVSSAPGLAEPFESVQDGTPLTSEHVKDVGTVWPIA
jgi:hypothetical protein